MVEACQRERWDRTSTLMALIGNCHRNPDKTPIPILPSDFNPFIDSTPKEKIENLGEMKQFFQ